MVRNTLQKWAYNLIINNPDLEEDVPYNLYACGNCFIEHGYDKERTNRKQLIENTKKYKTVCDCGEKSSLKAKFKICSRCLEIKISNVFGYFLYGPCQDCTDHKLRLHKKKKKVKKEYYQRNKLIEKPQGKLITELFCEKRTNCLDFDFYSRKKYVKRYLCCNGCKEKEVLDLYE